MRKTISTVTLSTAILGLIVFAGCASDAPPPARVGVPDQPSMDAGTRIAPKPLPPITRDDVPPPPFDDVALVSQQAPETSAFLQSYVAVGRPRILVFVNRTLEGEVMPVNPNDPLIIVDHTRQSSGAVTVDQTSRGSSDTYIYHDEASKTDKFSSNGPVTYKENTSLYLKPGQYDEVAAKSLDYEAIETILTDFLSCDGQVTLTSPTLARQKLTPEQVKQLESGQPQVASEIVQQLGAEILVQVTAHPTQQTQQGLAVRLVCEAMNIKGGQSLGRAVVDVPPPLVKTTINKFTRFCARKLMKDMINTWSAPPPAKMNGTPGGPTDRPPVVAPTPGTTTTPATMPERP